uniref:Uncharacterized protein n=1 Tax=Hyaloperonospora arabidopsidis (strain Emoy2) TaxID=559515 RepID=M4C1Y8_HYAAE
MAWREPHDLFGTSPCDRMMMEEVLELLSTGSPTSDYELFSSDACHNCDRIQNGREMLEKCLVVSPEATMGSQSDALVQEVKCDEEMYVRNHEQESSPAPDQARATRHVM